MVGPKPGGGAKMGGAGGRPGGPGGMGMPGGAPGGGFSESMDEDSMMQALGGAGGGTNSAGGSGGNQGGSTKPGGNSISDGSNIGGIPDGIPGSESQVEPREVGTIGEEAKRGLGDAWEEVKKFFSINAWLGIDPENMDPEEQAKAKEFHARYQQLDQEQQAVAKQMHQEKMQKKQMQEEEDKRKKEIEAQQKAQSVQMPSSPQKGAAGQGGKSKKGNAMQKLQQDRTTIGTTQGE